ncbi:MAG: hypothetical protein LBJ92_03645 [Holosporales bacterium]|nr:hypothetical protein [Holosporales bacterium]
MLLRRGTGFDWIIHSVPFAGENLDREITVGFYTCAAAYANFQLDQEFGEWSQRWDGLYPYPHLRLPLIGGLTAVSAGSVLAGGWFFHKWMAADSQQEKSLSMAGLITATAIGASSIFASYKIPQII